jgi:hypothetical protein
MNMSAAVDVMLDRIDHAHGVARFLQALGWIVAFVGLIGALVFAGFWIAGDLSVEQAVSLILGTTLATVMAEASAYGAGVNVGLGADRLSVSIAGSDRPPVTPGQSDGP